MTWLTWRQFRTPVALVTGLVAIIAVAMVATRPGLMDLYRATGLDTCGTLCGDQADDFLGRVTGIAAGPFYWVGFAAVYLIPAVIGIFWGAPMVARELETGTFRLVWSQSTTRTRWLAVKLLAGAAAAMAAAGLLSLVVSWFSGPFDHAYDNRLVAEVFGARGVVPIAYAALAFVLGVLAGTVLRRTVPAMAITLILIGAIQVIMPTMVRPHLIPPETYTGVIAGEEPFTEFMMSQDGTMTVVPKLDKPGAWVLENRAVKTDGTTFTGPSDPRFCGPRAAAGPRACEEWVLSQGLRQDTTYQPAGRFWPLQWIESALVLVVAGLLGALTFWWIRRRLS